MAEPTVAAAGINAGSSIANNLITQAFAGHNRRENYRYNEMAAKKADQRQRAQYTELYSPKAMMEQYAAAGLSPSMMMSGGQSAVGQSSAQGNQSAGIQGPYPSATPIDPLAAAQMANIMADTKKKEAETDNIETDTELKGQEIINLVADTANKKAENRLITANADLAECNATESEMTLQARIEKAYYNSAIAAAELRSAIVKADLDESTFDAAYQLAYANLDNTLTNTEYLNSEIKVNKKQIQEITERIRNSQWQTWATEKEQNRKDAIFKFDKARFETEVKQWAAEQNLKLAIAEIQMVSDLVGYVCNFATSAMSNVTELKKSQAYIDAKKEIANKPTTTHTQNYHIDDKGRKVIHGGQYKEQK